MIGAIIEENEEDEWSSSFRTDSDYMCEQSIKELRSNSGDESG